MSLSKLSLSLLVGVAIAAAGCGGAGSVPHPVVVPTAGVVSYQGATVAGAAIVFVSPETTNAGWICSGRTDSSGKFEITSIFAPGTEAKGIPAGDYTAVVTKFEEPASAPRAHDATLGVSSNGNSLPANVSATKSAIPMKYATEQTSDLKFKIEGQGKSDLEVKLVD